MTALAASQGADELGNLDALTDGYSAAFLGAAGIAVAGALAALVTLRRAAGAQAGDTPTLAAEPKVAA